MTKIFLYLTCLALLSSCAMKSNKQDFKFLGYVLESKSVNDIESFIDYDSDSLLPINNQYISLGHFEKSLYIKLIVRDDLSDEVFLSFSNPMLTDIEVYDANAELVASLGRMNFVKDDYGSFFNITRLSLKQGLTYYVKISSYGSVTVPIDLFDESDFQLTIDERNVLFGVYFGIVVAMFFYNLFLWFSTRDKIYGIYITYILVVGMTQGVIAGYLDVYLWPESVFLKQNSYFLFTVLVNIVGIYYSLKFLIIKDFNKKLWDVGLSIIGIYILVFLAFLFDLGSINSRVRVLQVFLGIVPFYLLFISIYSFKKGYRPAKFFLISWSLLITSMIIFLLTDLNILPNNFFTNYIFTFGSACEALLLSFALADKINILKKEKEKEQAERLLILAENEQLVREQNIMLEDKVKIRTDELEQALRNLQNTQSQLVNQEKMASLGQLTAGIAHEINNPINFVSSNIMPLKRDLKDIMEVIEFYRTTGAKEFTLDSQKQAKQLEEDLELDYVLDEVEQLLKGMDDGARRTVEIVKGLRLFSRVDEQDMKKVDIHDGINSTVILLNSTMPPKIRVIRDFAELPLVECLAGKINQVFMNIINNAVHALADHIETIDDPKIELRTRSLGDFVTIEIIDNGPGMPEQVKQRIFEPFFTTKAVGKGTGLGLSIVYSIIENHKGTLEVITEESQGTTFKITLPIYQSTQRYE
ncbi:7TM diverse intracellular signaling domain-containing protein [Algoriphagus sp. D3-2-R+10]|uniref:7TM diverse intracellular signaling domain-containing protein n=1 Tax=Algoriphagus aurantiacus TaxID=3103948 RepID=UPI002B3855DC|nr:7TM diverse intracellular signaling domain-containing protein [Algoriphagus sp. D3-2-R+10]MEB2777291.1 7TM diverse intracellular signaling domain-containing protein [Algoriphagus sp. D3-2-R+10]